MKKRPLTLIVTAALGGALIAGCGSGGSSEGPPEAGGGAVPSEAESLATGDIPDNQEFLTYADKPAGYSIKYPAGWARTGTGNDVTFREKGNVIHVAVRSGAAHLAPGEKKSFTRKGAPDPVTGKRVPLVVDVYEYEKGGKVAVLELETPEGVDNVDAYRMISESFRWR